jgi:hypothetical protein
MEIYLVMVRMEYGVRRSEEMHISEPTLYTECNNGLNQKRNKPSKGGTCRMPLATSLLVLGNSLFNDKLRMIFSCILILWKFISDLSL